jgi:hypothetical protein
VYTTPALSVTNSIPATPIIVGSEKRLVAALQTGVDIVDDRELRGGPFSSWAYHVPDGAGIGRAQLEPGAGVDLDRIDEAPADKLSPGDQRNRRPHVFLYQMQAIDRRLVIQPVDIIA